MRTSAASAHQDSTAVRVSDHCCRADLQGSVHVELSKQMRGYMTSAMRASAAPLRYARRYARALLHVYPPQLRHRWLQGPTVSATASARAQRKRTAGNAVLTHLVPCRRQARYCIVIVVFICPASDIDARLREDGFF